MKSRCSLGKNLTAVNKKKLRQQRNFRQVLKNNLKQIDLNARQIESYANKWSEGEMIRQIKEMKKLYEDSLKGLNNGNK